MWRDLDLIAGFLLDSIGAVVALYTAGGILSAVLALWVIRRVLRAFGLIT